MGFGKQYWNYLRNRTQYVEVDEILTKPEIFEFGVPQGTVLGPLVFNIYINDFLMQIKLENSCYVDDTVIIYHSEDWDLLKKSKIL